MFLAVGLILISAAVEPARLPAQHEDRYLYVALPGPDQADADHSVRILVFDISNAPGDYGGPAIPDGSLCMRRLKGWKVERLEGEAGRMADIEWPSSKAEGRIPK